MTECSFNALAFLLDFVLARKEKLAIDWPPRAATKEDARRLPTITEKNTAQVHCVLEDYLGTFYSL